MVHDLYCVQALLDGVEPTFFMNLEIRSAPLRPTGMLAEELRTFCRVVRGLESVPIGATYEDAIQVQRWIQNLEVVSEGSSGPRRK
jgi:hypothetical protein